MNKTPISNKPMEDMIYIYIILTCVAKAAWGFNQHHKHVGYYPEIKVGNGQATI
jgi:hypothetical protein